MAKNLYFRYNIELKYKCIDIGRIRARGAALAVFVSLANAGHSKFYYIDDVRVDECTSGSLALFKLRELVHGRKNHLDYAGTRQSNGYLMFEIYRLLAENEHISNMVNTASAMTMNILSLAWENKSNTAAMVILDHTIMRVVYTENNWFDNPEKSLRECVIMQGNRHKYDYWVDTTWDDLTR